MAKKIDIIDVMLAVHKGELKIVTQNGFFLMEDMKSGERVRLNEAYVMCKDCKYAGKDGIHQVSLKCTRFKTGQYTHRMKPNDFCSYGERKDNENE